MDWTQKLALWVAICVPLLMFRIWIGKRFGRIDGSRRSVIMSLLTGACFAGVFGVMACVPHSVNACLCLALELGLFVASNVFDGLTPMSAGKTDVKPTGQSV